MMTFSWEKAKQRAIDDAIKRNKILAKTKQNPDFNLKHPDWTRDANLDTPNFTQLVKQTKEQCEKIQQEAITRRLKRLGL